MRRRRPVLPERQPWSPGGGRYRTPAHRAGVLVHGLPRTPLDASAVTTHRCRSSPPPMLDGLWFLRTVVGYRQRDPHDGPPVRSARKPYRSTAFAWLDPRNVIMCRDLADLRMTVQGREARLNAWPRVALVARRSLRC